MQPRQPALPGSGKQSETHPVAPHAARRPKHAEHSLVYPRADVRHAPTHAPPSVKVVAAHPNEQVCTSPSSVASPPAASQELRSDAMQSEAGGGVSGGGVSGGGVSGGGVSGGGVSGGGEGDAVGGACGESAVPKQLA